MTIDEDNGREREGESEGRRERETEGKIGTGKLYFVRTQWLNEAVSNKLI